GRVPGTSVLDGGAPPGGDVPVYAVEAVQGGRNSTPVRSDDAAPGRSEPGRPESVDPGEGRPGSGGPAAGYGQPADLSGGPAGPSAVRAERAPDGSVVVTWSRTGQPEAEFRVRCRMPDGRWRVVGRTRGHRIEDGGAPDGPVSEYTVSAAVDGVRSPEVDSGRRKPP
ncbi:MAG: hypothetical protein L0I24_15980, partial [Pseudonocardia sp.]|nr:hypothetical protein [Pseudonocardia sp.]